jgi:uncharacterized membrane protein YphA (DoxX/SURF4 family)
MSVAFRVLDGKDCLFLEALGFFCGRIEVGNDCASTTIASVEEAFEWNTCLREIRRTNISKEMAILEMQEKSAGLQKTREGLFTSIATYAYLEDLAPGKIELDFCQIPSCRFPPFIPHVSELVVQKFALTQYIPVSAAMWVFAVGMIELVVGVLLLIGFQVRLVSIITFTILIVTFFFFKEDVYSHVTLFGTLSVLMITGAGPLSLDRIRYPQTRMS